MRYIIIISVLLEFENYQWVLFFEALLSKVNEKQHMCLKIVCTDEFSKDITILSTD